MGFGQPQPPKNSNLKWWLSGAAVLVTIALVGGVAVACSKGDPGSPGASTSAAASDIASANDTGPVSLILGDPTCGPGTVISDQLNVDMKSTNGLDANKPASQWTSEERTAQLSTAAAFKKTADALVPLAKQTPHRIMRELYEQAIFYYRYMADRIPTYTVDDNVYYNAASNFFQAAGNLCSSDLVTAHRGGLASPPPDPITPGETPNPENPKPLMTSPDPACDAWQAENNATVAALKPWAAGWNTLAPLAQWDAQDQETTEAAIPVLKSDALQIGRILKQTSNPVLQDFFATLKLYQETFIGSLSTYAPEDFNLYGVATALGNGISAACQAKI